MPQLSLVPRSSLVSSDIHVIVYLNLNQLCIATRLSIWGFLMSSDRLAAVNFTHAWIILESKSLTLSWSVPLHLAGSMSSCWLGAGGHSSTLLLLWPGSWRWHWRWRFGSWRGAHCTQQQNIMIIDQYFGNYSAIVEKIHQTFTVLANISDTDMA